MAFVAMRLLDELAMRIGVDGIVISQLSFLSFFFREDHVRIPGIEASHLCRARLHVNIGQENTPDVVYKMLPRLLAGNRKV